MSNAVFATLRSFLAILVVAVNFVASLPVTAQSASLPADWEIMGILPPAGTGTGALWAINDAGRAVGEAFDAATGASTPFLLVDGELRLLGGDGASARPWDISNNGVVIGSRYEQDGASFAVVLRTGEVMDIAPGEAYGVNGSEQIVGHSANAAIVWSESGMATLPNLFPGGSSLSLAVNDAGDVVGRSSEQPDAVATQSGRAVIWRDGEVVDLTAPTGTMSQATDINNHGQVVGVTLRDGSAIGWSWQDGVITELPATGFDFCIARQVNDLGWISGTCRIGAESKGVVWVDGELTILESLLPADSGWVLQSAQALNNVGQFVGTAQLNGVQQLFVLTPLGFLST